MNSTVDRRAPDNHWHLDKRVPITIIIALVANMGTGLWFVSKLDSRIAALETLTIMQTNAQHERDMSQDGQVKDAIELLTKHLDRMDDKLDRIVEKQASRK